MLPCQPAMISHPETGTPPVTQATNTTSETYKDWKCIATICNKYDFIVNNFCRPKFGLYKAFKLTIIINNYYYYYYYYNHYKNVYNIIIGRNIIILYIKNNENYNNKQYNCCLNILNINKICISINIKIISWNCFTYFD